ncbi:ATP-binding cassette domain-containing protein [Candidatus Woesearchaeota archaeon]|nr:ATP-binding cassette domain-containing protein [Candidatus Woesearchaeota archaeon]
MPRKKPLISVRNLTKKYKDLKAVDDVTFDVEKGSIFAFLGPNGAGKSTTIRMLTTLTQPTSGSLTIDGIDVTEHPHDARKRFGIVFQDPSLDEDLTAMENLSYHAALYSVPKKLREKRIKQALELVELQERKDDLVKTFSGGMKRRLEIARGLIHHPQVLFLDEPTTGLDPQTRTKIWNHIQALNKKEKLTIFLTTHYMPEAEAVADRIAVIDHGTIKAQGTLADLKEQTKAKDLDEAFLNLTGRELRDEKGDNNHAQMRLARRLR